MTKKLLVLLLACVLYGTLVFAGCSNASQEKTDEASESKVTETEGTEVEPVETEIAETEISQADIEKCIIGKWINAEWNGQPVLTNTKAVFDFVSNTRAYMSTSLNSTTEVGAQWIEQLETDVNIVGNKMILTNKSDEKTTWVGEYTIITINDNEFIADFNRTLTVDGKKSFLENEATVRYVKVDADYSEDILGVWEGRCLTEKFVYNDGKAHRWEFKDDGTYAYYTEKDSNWIPSNDTLNEYFVDGNLLCVRWVEDGTENREWWEIAIDGDAINWTALCDDEEGNIFTAEYVMNRSAQKHQSPQEQTEGYYWYEAVFLDAEEVEQVFSMASDDYPYFEFVPESFHITTQFKPEVKNENLYGTPVTVHIIGYVSGSVQDTQENITSNNEGLLVELSSTDEMMQALIDNCDKTFHITGSYSVGAKYTEQLDFSNVTLIDKTIEGVFGMADSNGNVILEHQG